LLEGVARRQRENREQHEADPGEDGNRDEQAPQQVLGHARRARGQTAGGPPARDPATLRGTSSAAPRSRSPSRSAPPAAGCRPPPPRDAAPPGSLRRSGSPARSS